MKDTWYHITDAEQIDTPALLLFADRIKANIDTAIAMAGSPARLRPHVKTHKSADVTRLMLNAGISSFKCATIAEADMLGACGAADVLLAYTLSAPKLRRFIQLQQLYPATRFSCVVDHIANAALLQERMQSAGRILTVYIDLNTGMNRSGIVPEEAEELCTFVHTASHLELAGLHAYDGHIRDVDLEQRRRRCDEAFDRVLNLQQKLHDQCIPVPGIIAGGSPSFPIHAQRSNVVCSPGTFVFWDKGYLDGCPEQAFLPAAVLLSRIVSNPLSGIVCADLGHKSVASENDLQRRAYFLNADGLEAIGHSEEHLVLKVASNAAIPPVGTLLWALPYHVCPTVALYERAVVIENNQVAGEWFITARNRKLHV